LSAVRAHTTVRPRRRAGAHAGTHQSLQAGSEASVPERGTLGVGVLVSRRVLLAIALLSLAIAAALSQTVNDRRQVVPAARSGSALHGD
jgi:folate-binding Fe-S cluster repair protein YgfZ